MCVQVLRLLEDVGLPELVVQLASLAITEAASDVNSQVTFSTQVNRHVNRGVERHETFNKQVNI